MDTDSTSATALTLQEIVLLGTSQHSLADVQRMKGSNTACIAAVNHMYDLFMQLATWNKLFPVRLQHRDVSGVCPQMCLVPRSRPHFEEFPLELDLVQKASTCAQWLLNSHRCVVALQVSLEGLETWEDMFFEDPKGSSSVMYLNINCETSAYFEKLCMLVLSVKSLEESEIANEEGASQLASALSSLLRSTVSLRVFKIQRLKVYGDASVLLRALFANSTLNRLSLYKSILSRTNEKCRKAFAKYVEESVTLTTLSYTGHHMPSSGSTLICVIYGSLRNKYIRNLSLTEFFLDCESNSLISKLLETSECLHSVNITSKLETFGTKCWDRQKNHTSWLLALMRSKTLREVTFSTSFCNAAMWRIFLEALTSNAPRTKVIVDALFDSQDVLADVSKTLRERSMDDQVLFSELVCLENLEVLKCRALSRVFVLPQLNRNSEHWPLLHQLSSCSHVTSVWRAIEWPENDAPFASAAAYVETTATLKKLGSLYPAVPQKDFILRKMFTSSLARNSNIRELSIEASNLDVKCSEFLADTVKSRENSSRLHLNPVPSVPLSSFNLRLGVGIADNLTLLNLNLPGWMEMEAMGDWFVLQETVKRNTGILRRATEFVTGASRDRCGAQALERVSANAELLEELMQMVSVESCEAAYMIRRALRCIEGMHDFMILSGVVRDRVVCLPREDGRTQLDDLDEDSWTVVRRYLLLEDVRCS